MKIAYADPPYIGQARKHYLEDARCAEVDHVALIQELSTYDGWALSASSPSLREILSSCPPKVRVAAWVKPFAAFKIGVDPAYSWEPVIFVPARKGSAKSKPTSKDWVEASAIRSGPKTRNGGITGRKPPAFCSWLFAILRAEPEDEFFDLFPGSGAVSHAWDLFRARML